MQPALRRLRTSPSPLWCWGTAPVVTAAIAIAIDQSCCQCRRQSCLVQRASSTKTAAPRELLPAQLSRSKSKPILAEEPSTVLSTNVGRDEAAPRIRKISVAARSSISIPSKDSDCYAWVQCLEACRRIHGLQGTADIWRAMVKHELDLPTDGNLADTFWMTVLELGFSEPSFLDEIYEYSLALLIRSGMRWSKLYNSIVGHFLIKDPRLAYKWHRKLQGHHPTPAGGLREIARKSLGSEASLEVFRRIYLDHEDQKIYSTIIPLFCDGKRFREAVIWHKLLLRRGDLPINSLATEPLRKYLQLYSYPTSIQQVNQGLNTSDALSDASASRALRQNTFIFREIMNKALGEVHNIRPKTLSDEFCARLFATTAFSVDTIISGLRMLGVEEIGPMSLRELAIRSGGPEAIIKQLSRLKAAGIEIAPSVFSKCLRNFAVRGEKDLLDDLFTSDMHPEAFEDRKLQEELFVYYHKTQDWRHFSRTLGVLMASDTSNMSEETWNLILRSHVSLHDWGAAQHSIKEMQRNGIRITTATSQYILGTSLRQRRKGKHPVSLSEPSDDLKSAITLWLDLLRSGSSIAPSAWTEILRRLGMGGRMDELEKLALWLTDWYSPSTSGPQLAPLGLHEMALDTSGFCCGSPEVPRSNPKHPLRLLFPKALQGAFITWGFRNLSKGPVPQNQSDKRASESGDISAIATNSWPKGLLLLRALKEKGVPIHTSLVRRVCKQNFRMLFGPGKSAVRVNRRAAARNPFKLEEMVTVVQDIWGEHLFKLDETLHIESTSCARRGPYISMGHAHDLVEKHEDRPNLPFRRDLNDQ